jgi:glycosyltransferase involved in cell wall biosynthesis
MKVLMIHNEYAAVSGEEVQFYHIAGILRKNKHNVELYTRSSAEIGKKLFDKVKAFFTGIYNPSSKKKINEILDIVKPDVVFVQNLFPLISPSILPKLKKAGVPVVMRVANYRLMCPNGLHLSHGEVCERCLQSNEFWCILRNCEENIFKSIGYALRNAVARIMGFYTKSVSAYICASQFLRNRMISAGYDKKKIHVIPNIVPNVEIGRREELDTDRSYVAYVGRISIEKGIYVLLEAARMCPDIPFKLAGNINPSFRLPDPLPQNVQLVGFMKQDDLSSFYKQSRIFISTSICFETFGISVAEAMLYSKPVIVSRIGVFPEFVQDGVTGLLTELGNAEDLADKIKYLWNRPDLCHKMGEAGRERALKEYSSDTYYERLMKVFRAVEHINVLNVSNTKAVHTSKEI